MIEPISSERRRQLAKRWKIVGIVVLVVGLGGAPIHYWVRSRQVENLSDSFPSDEKARRHEMGIQMGTFGLVMMEWSDALDEPGTQAILMAAGSLLFARFCYFVASRIIDES